MCNDQWLRLREMQMRLYAYRRSCGCAKTREMSTMTEEAPSLDQHIKFDFKPFWRININININIKQ